MIYVKDIFIIELFGLFGIGKVNKFVLFFIIDISIIVYKFFFFFC